MKKSKLQDNEFTVLMAFYHKDNPSLLRMALNSVVENTVKPKEILLIQDGPIPSELRSVLSDFSTVSYLRVIELEKNLGLSAALNIGLQHVQTRYVFRADADDFNIPERFQKQLDALKEGHDIVGGFILEKDMNGNEISFRSVPTSQHEIIRNISKRNPFNHMTVAFKLSSVIAVGGYPSIHLKEDYALWILMIASGAKAINLDEVLVHATAGDDMYKRRGGIKYAISEVKLQRFMVKNKMNSWFNAFLIGSMRSFVFILPNFFRAFIYENFLRRSVKVNK